VDIEAAVKVAEILAQQVEATHTSMAAEAITVVEDVESNLRGGHMD
jgi:hypothetical protein